MIDQLNSDLFDPINEMDSDYMRGASVSGDDFGFAFNDSNFSDRLLKIEIMGPPSDCAPDGEGCTSIADWASHRKRRREDFKKENGLLMFPLASFFLNVPRC
ncbi:hypothetical protein F3Y22_tig00110467pilonHSYRG00219 [Hibiscus syriacus]|uniref:Uncharacterized protein n=1 Tax=Hibiscus syriacus TaxID=106335 RepID=A0A6A3AGG2_HIBSY|nr:hypothetical protein F3Y22_tig00110467pilonHSYRG00219 [Hibiscus syriacus]